MVVDDVDDDRDAVGVRVADEALERVRAAVARLDREQVGRVVAPRDVAGELERRHDLDGRHAEVLEVGQPAPGVVERARRVVGRRERADVHLVDDEVVPRRHLERVVAPVEAVRVVDDAVADRVRDLPGVRIHPRQVARRCVRIVKRYSAPGPTPGTSADHVPLEPSPSGPSAVRSPAQSSKVPVTKTASAWGAQTRNVVPSPYGIAPMPARGDGALLTPRR